MTSFSAKKFWEKIGIMAVVLIFGSFPRNVPKPTNKLRCLAAHFIKDLAATLHIGLNLEQKVQNIQNIPK
jgi:hypothetical protein